jgi:hypothetical protein
MTDQACSVARRLKIGQNKGLFKLFTFVYLPSFLLMTLSGDFRKIVDHHNLTVVNGTLCMEFAQLLIFEWDAHAGSLKFLLIYTAAQFPDMAILP